MNTMNTQTPHRNGGASQTVDKLMRQKLDTHGESASGDWLFPLAYDILKKENFFGSSPF